MKAKELRLGDLIYKNDVLTIVTIDILKEILEHEMNEFNDVFKPIKITDAWLHFLGFISYYDKNFGRNNHYFELSQVNFRLKKIEENEYMVDFSIKNSFENLSIIVKSISHLQLVLPVFTNASIQFVPGILKDIPNKLKEIELDYKMKKGN
jgi:hypothetical protein